jgi:hypothetical protein
METFTEAFLMLRRKYLSKGAHPSIRSVTIPLRKTKRSDDIAK